MEYHQVISLGAWCQVAQQLHRVFPDQPSCVFDWLVSPHDSLVEVLKDDGARLAQKVTTRYDASAVLCREYGLLYKHDFPVDPATNTVTLDVEAFVNVRSKLTAKMNKFLAACDNGLPTLFVRFGGFGEPAIADPYVKEQRVFTFDRLQALDDQLARKMKRTPYHLAWVYHPELTPVVDMPAVRGNVSTHPFPLPALETLPLEYRWAGAATMWDEFFSRFAFAPGVNARASVAAE